MFELEKPVTGSCPNCGGNDLYMNGHVELYASAGVTATLDPDGSITYAYDNYDFRDKPEDVIRFVPSGEVGCNTCYKNCEVEDLKSVTKAPTLTELQNRIKENQ